MSSFSSYTFGNGGQPFLFTVKNASSLQTKKEINFDLEQPEIGFAKENFIYGWRKDGNADLVFDSLKYDDSRYELINSTETTSHRCFHNCIKALGLCLTFDFNQDTGICFRVHLKWAFHGSGSDLSKTQQFLQYDDRRRKAAYLVELPKEVNFTPRAKFSIPSHKLFYAPSSTALSFELFFRNR